VLNVGFALLRVPLAVDLKAKTGELEDVLRDMDARRSSERKSESRHPACRRCCRWMCCCCCYCGCQLLRPLWICLRTQARYFVSFCRSKLSGTAVRDDTTDVATASTQAQLKAGKKRPPLPRARSRVGRSRMVCAQKIQRADNLLESSQGQRKLTSEDLQTIMTQINAGQMVSDEHLHQVHATAVDNTALSVDSEVVVDVPKLKRAVSGWAWQQVEQSNVLPAFDQIECVEQSNGADVEAMITLEAAVRLLERLNDEIQPTLQEVVWLMKMCPSCTHRGQPIKDYTAAISSPVRSVLLAKSEVREAVRVWYPAQARRRQLHELRKVQREVAGPARRAIAAQYDTNLHEVAIVLKGHRTNGGQHGGTHELRDVMRAIARQSRGWRRTSTTSPMAAKIGQSDAQPTDQDVQHVLNIADVTEPDELGEPYSHGSDLHKSLALWATLEGSQQRIDDCFTKYCLVEHVLAATKVFNDFVDDSLIEGNAKHTKHPAPDWFAEKSALRSTLRQLSLGSLKEEVRKAGVDARMISGAHSVQGTLQRGQVHDFLTELNEGIKVSWDETDWAIETADVDGNGELDREELRAAVSWWYCLHVIIITIRTLD
jgi:hypothetical protein